MKTRTAAALVTAATIAIYWRALHAGFVGDDVMILHRLRALRGAGDALGFFHGEFFEYYRPLGFLAHAADWAIAGANPWQFHLTNLLLHAIDAVLLLLIGRELSPRSPAGPIAALLFALHASNHEAVVWISARFDLLATGFSLAAIWWMLRSEGRTPLIAPLLFLCAVLSKESAVALPAAAAAFAVFQRRSGPIDAARQLVPWLLALAVYSLLRHLGGGVSAIAGTNRIPKLLAFLVMLGALLFVAGDRWLRVRAWLRDHLSLAMAAIVVGLTAAAVVAAAGGAAGRLAADKLAVAGFAIFHLVFPVLDVFRVPFYLEPGTTRYWLGGAIAVAAAAAVLALVWRRLIDDDRIWFLGAFLAAALLPISALTEGARYLYLPSAALSLAAGLLIGELQGRARATAVALVAAFLAVSAGQIALKVRDWNWAGRLTSEGARLVDASLAPACGEGHVVFLTEPVGIRAVYTHFYYETFELPRGCMPSVFDILVRIFRIDAAVDARWDGPSTIVITAADYRDNFVLSEDLRRFDIMLRGTPPVALHTALGELTCERIGRDERLTLALRPGLDREQMHFFYYSDGRIRPLPRVK
jgi:hypothetical protein